MRFRSKVSTAMALAVFIATPSQYGVAPSADAHVGRGTFTRQGHIKTPPKVKAVAFLNVRDFGATGNGTTDDSTAIQNTANAAASSGKGVFFPAGTYLHFSSMESLFLGAVPQASLYLTTRRIVQRY